MGWNTPKQYQGYSLGENRYASLLNYQDIIEEHIVPDQDFIQEHFTRSLSLKDVLQPQTSQNGLQLTFLHLKLRDLTTFFIRI